MSSSADDPPPLERLAALALFGPLDLTIKVVEELPSSVDRARQQLVAARFLGKMVVDQSLVQARRRLGITTVPRSDDAASASEADASPVTDPGAERPDGETARNGDAIPDAADLALPDYEHLPDAHVVAKLAGLTAAERDDIEAFETAHRHRRTILGKLRQLQEA